MRWIAAVALLAGSALAACTTDGPSVSASVTPQATIQRATYEVSFDLEYGYVFERGGHRFFPEIAESERPKFDQFFGTTNMRSMLGKRVSFYCDCEVSVSSDGSTKRVEKAVLYAR